MCDIHPSGNHGVVNIRKRFPKARFYTDFRELLSEEKDLDAVTVSTPDHTHGIIAKTAMENLKLKSPNASQVKSEEIVSKYCSVFTPNEKIEF